METKKILERLKSLKIGLGNKPSDFGEDCFHFYPNKIIATNDNIRVSCKNILGVNGSFPAKDILKGLEVIKDVDVDIYADNAGYLFIESQTSKIKICPHEKAYDKNEDLAKILTVRNWLPIPEGFMEGLRLCAETASKEIRDGEVACVAVRNNVVEATDNIRASVFQHNLNGGEFFLVASSVKKLPDDCESISVRESLVHFKSGNFIYSLPVVVVDFPEISKVILGWIPKDKELMEFPKELISMAKELDHFCEGYDYEKEVKITFTKQHIKCTAQKDTAKIIKKMANTTDRKDGSFRINPVMLSSLIKDHEEAFIHEDKLFFIRKGFVHVIGM